jgi:hypothetical protein
MFPTIVKQSGRKFVFRSGIEQYKAARAAIPYQPSTEPDALVPWKIFAREMGVCTRTLWTWYTDATKAVAAADPVRAPN